MTKTKFFITSVVILGVLNLVMVAGLYMQKPLSPHKERMKGPKNLIIKRLNLDENQTERYLDYIRIHKQQIEEKEMAVKLVKNQLYSTLQQKEQSNKDILINEIADLRKEIEIIHFNHFKDIKALCRNDQLEAFNGLTNDLAKFFAPHHKR